MYNAWYFRRFRESNCSAQPVPYKIFHGIYIIHIWAFPHDATLEWFQTQPEEASAG